MATTPALVTATKLDNGAIKDVKVAFKRSVTYIVKTGTSATLSLPYAAAVGGAVQAAYTSKPKRVSGGGGKIVVNDVDPGTEVSLYLNSDAHPDYRKNPVFKVTPNERNVIVTISEKTGKHSDTDTPVQVKDKDEKVEAAKKADTYTAVLTGDTWMKISHKYTSGEVDALLPANTSAAVTSAVKSIYDGLAQASLTIVLAPAAGDTPEKKLSVTFDDSNNPNENINAGYTLLAEGLPRVHPAGFAAVFNAGVEAGVSKIAMSSAWRPMLGSIAHRAGLGLDVNYVGATRMNRKELRNAAGPDTTNVSEEEKTLLTAFEKSKTEQASAKKAMAKAAADVKKNKDDPVKSIEAAKALKDATEASKKADEARKSAEADWNAERDKNEPAGVRVFRGALMKCACVTQLFDPWFMDSNTRDNAAADPNMQKTSNETLHSHHLHLTVYEPKIL